MFVQLQSDKNGRCETFTGVNSGAAIDVTDFTTSATGERPGQRQAVVVTNCDATAGVYLATANGGSTPVLATDDFEFYLAPKTEKVIHAGLNKRVWAINDGAGDTNVRTTEWQ